MDSRILSTSLALAITLALTASAQDAPDLSDHPWIGDEAPEFSAPRVDGDAMSLRDLRGKYIVLHFGASW